MRPLRPLALLALATAASTLALAAPALPAGASTTPSPGPTGTAPADPTPSATPTADLTPTATPTADPTPPPPVRVTEADSGRAVLLAPGQVLRVELAPAAAPWLGLEESTPLLQLLGYSSGSSGLGATLRALAPGGPQRLTATAGERTWALDVQVGAGTAVAPRGCAPSGTPTPTAPPTAAPSASATSSPQGVPLGPADDGGRVTVRQDEQVSVELDDCAAPYGPVSVTGVLRRTSAGSSLPDGEAEAGLLPTGAGTATLRAQRDTPCASRGGAACPPPWTVVVDVVAAPCEVTLAGPARVVVGATVPLAGRARPGQAVEVLFRRRGATEAVVRRRLLADGTGTFATTYTALDDHRWSARTDRCASVPGLTQVLPDVVAPARVRRGTDVRLVVRAAPGAGVGVLFRRAGTTQYLQRRTGTAGSDGRFVTTFRPDVDHAVAATSLGRRSAVRVVQAR